jgi:RNA polymerase sigma-70 factor (ECF subfamily)
MPNEDSHSDAARESFVQLLTGEQTRLFRYITMLIGDVNDASNILQQTNLVLWRKANDFHVDMSFSLWSRKVAYFTTLAFIRDKRRDKLVFDEDVLQQLADRPAVADDDEIRVALRHCLGALSSDAVELLHQRYWPGKSIGEMARQRGKSEGAIKMALMRIRQTVGQCIERQMEGTP